MSHTLTISEPQDIAAVERQTAAYNAGLPQVPDGAGGFVAATPLTVEQYLLTVLPLPAWRERWAPAVIPSGEWLLRWTAPEKAWARASTDPQVRAWLVDLDAHATVDLTHAEVQQGVPYVCAAMEAGGLLAAGQGTVRAAAILAF